MCFLAERSDGHLIDFRRVRSVYKTVSSTPLTCHSAKKLGNGQDILLSADLVSETQYITCYVMCDEIGQYVYRPLNSSLLTLMLAGTMRYAELKPGLCPSVFPPPLVQNLEEQPIESDEENVRLGADIPRRRSGIVFQTAAEPVDRDDEFQDSDFDDIEFRKAGKSAKAL